MKIAHGVADLVRLRKRGQLYVDRTDRIPVLEELDDALLFLRPRRFGKSLWLSTLAAYYDLRTVEEHEVLFGGLAAGRDPTPLAHRYFILRWRTSACCAGPTRGRRSIRIISSNSRGCLSRRSGCAVSTSRRRLGPS